jgi:acyl-CoA thioesterase-1
MMKSSAILRRYGLFTLLLGYAAIAAEAPAILVLGDSLSAGYGIEVDQGWVTRLRARLERERYPHRVINASISGETTAGALARLDSLLKKHAPAVVIVELGGNDGLRGLSLEHMRANLARIIERSRAHGAAVLLVPMDIPVNYGPEFRARFRAIYDQLARDYAVPLSPFILHGIANQPELMQEDGIHPSAAAQDFMLDNVWPALAPML